MRSQRIGITAAVVGVLGLTNAASAYYSPNLGRWISRDPIGERGGRNLAESMLNDPISIIDPLGLRVRCKCEQGKEYLRSIGVDMYDVVDDGDGWAVFSAVYPDRYAYRVAGFARLVVVTPQERSLARCLQ